MSLVMSVLIFFSGAGKLIFSIKKNVVRINTIKRTPFSTVLVKDCFKLFSLFNLSCIVIKYT